MQKDWNTITFPSIAQCADVIKCLVPKIPELGDLKCYCCNGTVFLYKHIISCHDYDRVNHTILYYMCNVQDTLSWAEGLKVNKILRF